MPETFNLFHVRCADSFTSSFLMLVISSAVFNSAAGFFLHFWLWSFVVGVVFVLSVLVECYGLQCFDAVGWAAGRASGL